MRFLWWGRVTLLMWGHCKPCWLSTLSWTSPSKQVGGGTHLSLITEVCYCLLGLLPSLSSPDEPRHVVEVAYMEYLLSCGLLHNLSKQEWWRVSVYVYKCICAWCVYICIYLWSRLWRESVHGATLMLKAAASVYVGPSVCLCTFDLWVLVCDRVIPGHS